MVPPENQSLLQLLSSSSLAVPVKGQTVSLKSLSIRVSHMETSSHMLSLLSCHLLTPESRPVILLPKVQKRNLPCEQSLKGLGLLHWKGQGWEALVRGKVQLRRREVLYMYPSVDSLNKPRGNGLKLDHTAAKCSDLGHAELRRSPLVPGLLSIHQHSLNSQLPGRKTNSQPTKQLQWSCKFWPMGYKCKCKGWGGAFSFLLLWM